MQKQEELVVIRAVVSLDGPTTERALDVWPALVTGELGIVVAGTSCYLVVETAPDARAARALSGTERAVVAHAARGLPMKRIAYDLRIAPSTVSARLASAACKVGARSSFELVRLVALLTRSREPREVVDVALTPAERHVLALIKQGLTNEEIASRRSRSMHTVANQVASLLRKTKSPSRRALVVR